VLEIITYRYRGHSVADPDPPTAPKTRLKLPAHQGSLTLIHDTLVAEGVLTAELAKEIDTAARAEADRAAEFAEASRSGRRGHLKDIYWEEDNPAHKKSRGRIVFD